MMDFSFWKSGYRHLRRRALSAAQKASVFENLRKVAPNSLTTLVYHRIADPDSPDFYGYPRNVSATRESFAAHIKYLCRHFNLVSLSDCIAWVNGQTRLPENAVLITFDDGYRDNLLNAAPALKEHSVRAVLFVATGFLDDRQPFYWDWVWEAFHATEKRSAVLPFVNYVKLDSPSTKAQVAERWISESKKVDDERKKTSLVSLAEALDIAPPARPPQGTHLNSQDIVKLHGECFDFGSHTVNHPILSNVSLDAAADEIVRSRRALEEVLAHPVRCFAFPNGQHGDFGLEHEDLLKELGFAAAFQGYGGVSFSGEAQRRPFAIRRTCINLQDSQPLLAAKAAGLERVTAL